MTPTPGKPPQQKTIDSAKGDLARLGALAQSRHEVEQPADFRGGKIRINDEPRTPCHSFRETLGAPALAQLDRPPVLPDDRVVNRDAGGTLP